MELTTIQNRTNRMTVPDAAVRAGIVTPGKPVFWAYHQDDEAAYLASTRELFAGEAFQVIGEQRVGDQRIVVVPKLLFGARATNHPDAVNLFQFGQQVEWEVLHDRQMCRVQPL